MTIKEKARKAGNYALDRFLEATPLVALCTPIYGAIETFVNNWPYEQSLGTRIKGATVTYLGGMLFGTLNKESKKSNEALTAGLSGLVLTPPFYYLCGARDWKDMVVPTLAATAIGLIGGKPMRWCMDSFRELTGRGNSERLPHVIRSQSPKVKRSLAGALVTGSLASLATMYAFSSNNESVLPIPTTLEAQVISSP